MIPKRIVFQSLQAEIDAAFLYAYLSKIEKNELLSTVYAKLSDIETQHAVSFRDSFKQYPSLPHAPSTRAKILAFLAKYMGPQLILSTLIDLEKSIALSHVKEKEKLGISYTGHENNHARILTELQRQSKRGAEGSLLSQVEGRHNGIGGNALRAAVLGANDGLVSILSLVMGAAGATISSRDILIVGFAGLLAGAISMALGEWLSVQSSRELYERQIAIEAAELEAAPEQEAIELALIYQAKGFSKEEAEKMSQHLMQHPEKALDTLVREELGVDSEGLGGSAWEAAFTSFLLFAVGAIIPVLPFMFLSGMTAVYCSLLASTLGLFGIGAAITLLTGYSVLYSGLRQVIFGWAAAGVTYTIGHFLGVSIGG